jgi:hypothetical protein
MFDYDTNSRTLSTDIGSHWYVNKGHSNKTCLYIGWSFDSKTAPSNKPAITAYNNRHSRKDTLTSNIKLPNFLIPKIPNTRLSWSYDRVGSLPRTRFDIKQNIWNKKKIVLWEGFPINQYSIRWNWRTVILYHGKWEEKKNWVWFTELGDLKIILGAVEFIWNCGWVTNGWEHYLKKKIKNKIP